MIGLEDFKKLDLRAARILAAEKIENSDKLLKLQIDIGGERRQIVSGIALSYAPEDLIGREIIVIVNLEPRILRGVESQGMLLAIDTGRGTVLLTPDKEIEPGSKVS